MVVSRKNENDNANTVFVGRTKGTTGILELGNVLRPTNENQVKNPDPKKWQCAEKLEVDLSSCPIDPAHKGFAPSRAELEKQYSEAQRKRIAEERQRNEKTCREAVHHPQLITPKPRELTVPIEFNLSCSNTPSRGRSNTPSQSRCNTPARSECSDTSCDSSTRGRRGRSSSKQLTTPRAPNLRTAHRPRSLSRTRLDAPELSVSDWPRTLRSQSACSSRSSSRAGSRQASASPARSASSRKDCLASPMSRRQRCPRQNDSCHSIGSHMAQSFPAMQSCVGRSVDSRASNISKHLSTDEIEELHIASKRQEQKELRRLNERRGRKAIKYPEVVANHRSLSPLTVPKEFNLSCSLTPARSVMSEGDNDAGDQNWEHSLRSVSASSGIWEPELTIPNGPNLGTSQRSRSTSSCRSCSIGRGGRSSSLDRFPREQDAIERHLERVSCAKWQNSGQTVLPKQDVIGSRTVAKRHIGDDVQTLDEGSNGTVVNRQCVDDLGHPEDVTEAPSMCKRIDNMTEIQIPPAVDLDEWVKSANCVEERAQRRRQVEELKHKKQSDEKDAKLKIFKGPKFSQTKAHVRKVGV